MKNAQDILMAIREAAKKSRPAKKKVSPKKKKPVVKKKVATKKKAVAKKKATTKKRPVAPAKKDTAPRPAAKRQRTPKIGVTVDKLEASTKKHRTKVNPIGRIKILSVNPVVRNRQVIVKSEVQAKTKGIRSYQQTFVFSGVNFSETKDSEHKLAVNLRTGNLVFAETLDEGKHPMQLKCTCEDFRFVWAWWDNKAKALVGANPKPYTRVKPDSGRPPVNPGKYPGMCKHLLGVVERLEKNKLLK